MSGQPGVGSSVLAAPHQPGDDRPRARFGGVRLAVVLLVALIAVRVLSPESARLDDSVQDFVTLSLSVVIESLPFVFLGIILSIAVQLWVPDHIFFAVLPKRPLLRRAALSVLGVLLPVCECGNVPLARGLIARGLTVPEAMTFLLAAPIVNPITVVTTFQAFGWTNGILVARVLGGFLIANLVGALMSRHPDPMGLLTPGFRASCERHDDHSGHVHPASQKWRQSVRMFATETSSMMPALFVGASIAGAIQVAISRQVLVALGGNPIWSVVALMLLAFVVAMCSNVDAFFVLSLGSTFLPGAIVSFLVFGPMIDVKMLALLRTTFTVRTLAVMTLVVALCAATLGLAINYAL